MTYNFKIDDVMSPVAMKQSELDRFPIADRLKQIQQEEQRWKSEAPESSKLDTLWLWGWVPWDKAPRDTMGTVLYKDRDGRWVVSNVSVICVHCKADKDCCFMPELMFWHPSD